MSHSAAFLIKEPTGSHENKRKYVRLTVASRGTRHTKRNICSGKASPEASGGTGKNGAMPDPVYAVNIRSCTGWYLRALRASIAILRIFLHEFW